MRRPCVSSALATPRLPALNWLPIDDQTLVHSQSYFGQATGDLWDQLYLTVALRNDGFSSFAQNNPRAWYPKASAAWTFTKTAQVGDSLSLLLDQDVKVGDTVVVPRGTPVDATITQADPSGHAGTPGDIAFEVHSLTVHGTEIPLHGGETLEGASRYNARAFALIPVVGLIPAIATRGDDAEIKPGMFLTASVDADTDLKP